MQPNQHVTFVTDGGDDVRELPLYLNPQAEHLLDWFHITMRLTVMSQMAKGLRSRENPNLAAELAEELERLKWYLWHGNVFLALRTVDWLQLDVDNEAGCPEQRKLSKAVAEFGAPHRNDPGLRPHDPEQMAGQLDLGHAARELIESHRRELSSILTPARLAPPTVGARSAPARDQARPVA